ncbi:MAG: response regulator [Bacteroidetes bacterium]|nr:response regulator [Bacteroidota bacterium]
MGFLKNRAFKLDKRIYLVFAVVVCIAVANALLSTSKIRNNKNTIFEITTFTNPTLESLEEFNMLVTRSRMFITNWVYLPNNETDKEQLVQFNKVNYPKLKGRLTGLSTGWRSSDNVDHMNKLFKDYEEVIREQEKIMKSLVEFDDYQDPMKKYLAEEQLESEIIPRTNKILGNLRTIIKLKKDEAKIMQDHMVQDNDHLLMIVFSLAVLIVLSVMAAGIYMMKKIIIPLVSVKEIMLRMSKGELPDVNLNYDNNALAEMTNALAQLRDGLQRTSTFAGEIGKSNFNASFAPLSEKDVLGSALLEMRNKLKNAAESDALRNWISEGFAKISNILHRNTDDIRSVSNELISDLVMYVEAQQGVVYLVNDENEKDIFIEPVSFFAPGRTELNLKRIDFKEGVVGQVVFTNRRIHLQNVKETIPPIETGVAKIAVCDVFVMPLFAAGRVVGAVEVKSAQPLTVNMREFIERVAEPIASNILNLKANLLTRKLLEESQLKTRELAQQDDELRQINNELMVQSGRLKQSESALRKQQETMQKVNAELEAKALLLEEKNMTIEDAHKALAFKADQLERSSKYKSDFLANMSHELRTPLNSVLILAKLLSENRTGNMNPKQIEHAKVIHKSGSDLLVIINDILDLSKIEAGKLELIKEPTALTEIVGNMEQLFREVSVDKQISFKTEIDSSLKDLIHTDRVRIEQVLKNLLSNAFKFTPASGTVSFKVTKAAPGVAFRNEKLQNSKSVLCFSVTDTGIGVPEEKQKLIFEAFNQADTSITRKYGGTGLGLAISRQLTALLGGDIVLDSVENKGSTFSIYLPQYDDSTPVANGEMVRPVKVQSIKDDTRQAVIFAADDSNVESWKSLLAIENIKVTAFSVPDDISSAKEVALVIVDQTLSDKEYISMVHMIKGMNATKNAAIISRSVSEYVPSEIASAILLHTTAPVSQALISQILSKVYASDYALISESSEMNFCEPQEKTVIPMFKSLSAQNKNSISLEGKIVLIADDDMRNIYSLSTLFENEGATVVYAMDGLEALECLKENPGIDLILMDIMMPNMDGLQAMQEIRKINAFVHLPIIAVTAKAMRDDREICIRAGASEYITKPVNSELLMNHVSTLLKLNP